MSKKIFIIFEQKDGNLKKSSLELISAANKVSSAAAEGPEITGFIYGEGARKAAASLGSYGVKKVYIGEGDEFRSPSAEIFTETISEISAREIPDYLFASSNPFGKDLLPRLSAKLNKSYISDATDILEGSETVFIKPIFAGKVIAEAKVLGEGPVLVSFRPNAFPVPNALAAPKSIEILTAKSPMGLPSAKAKFTGIKAGQSAKLDLQEATIIVSGGRGMKSAENFKILQDMASVLGAAVGASRAAVDSEYASEDMQVGQTGKVVNPKLYVACGISGAIQHLAGMRTSKVIVAINKDPEAPIFKFADYGIVGDLFQIVPALTSELKKILHE